MNKLILAGGSIRITIIIIMKYYPSKTFKSNAHGAAVVAAAVRERRVAISLKIMQQLPPGHLNCWQLPTSQVVDGSSLLFSRASSQQIIRMRGERRWRAPKFIYSFDSCKSIRRGTSSSLLFLLQCKLLICFFILSFINTLVIAQEFPSTSVSPSISHSPALPSLSSPSPTSLSSLGSPSLSSVLSPSLGSPTLSSMTSLSGSPSLTTVASSSGSPSLSSVLSPSLGSPTLSSMASLSGSPSLTTVASSSGSPSLSAAASSLAASNSPTHIPLPSDRNFCGLSLAEAGENCSADRHCPMGNNNECPSGLYCYTFTACNIVGMPTMEPTISPKPTLNPASTMPPTTGPIAKDDIRNFFFCGVDYNDASERCYKRCMSGLHTECASGEECFSNAGCQELKAESTDDELSNNSTAADEEQGVTTNSTLSPDASPTPTIMQNVTYEPTAAPITKDDIRNFFFCGKNWTDASDRCYLRCLSGFHSDCPEGEECFAQADCRGVKEAKSSAPTNQPSMAPFSGTRSPTLSPMPTVSPSITPHPSVHVTLSPELVPSDPPTTQFPTDFPTLATCGGDPCPDPEQCRSIQNFCGVGETYCNEKSVWTASCGVPTDPPVTGSPTTIWPSVSPSMSAAPTGVNTHIPTENFSELLDSSSTSQTFAPSGVGTAMPNVVGESQMPSIISSIDTSENPTNTASSTPTVASSSSPNAASSSSPTYANVDDQTFAPDDPAGSFFCGQDWNQAITECPHRCPSGETTQCPEGMQCYAFTPCLAVGMNTPPSVKPTWEPTKHPILMTNNPTTTIQYWAAQNDANKEESAGETPTSLPTLAPVSAKPSNAPTQDKCRGFPCDYEGECRSSLGFCGTGVGYCNTVSSWVPECGGGKGLVRNPTASPNLGSTSAPAVAWEEWSKGEVGVVSNLTETDSSLSNNTYDPAVWANWGTPDESAQSKQEDSYTWWTTSSNSSMFRCCRVFLTAVMWAINFMALM